MARLTIVFGILLILLGAGYYFGTGQASWTALIPTIPGVLLVLLGWLALRENLRKHAMHAASMVGLLGFLAGASRLIRPATSLINGTPIEHRNAATESLVMALLCGVFLALCIRSFVVTRLLRRSQPSP